MVYILSAKGCTAGRVKGYSNSQKDNEHLKTKTLFEWGEEIGRKEVERKKLSEKNRVNLYFL